jgi:phospholipid/cholesterol/gamma-HCH transport system substrate-binding protein
VKRTGQVPFMKLKIGIFVVIACALLLWATFQSGSFRLGKEDEATVHFPTVGGLEPGAIVRLNGVPVGIVRKISLDSGTNEVAVKLGLKKGTRAHIHQGATARITTVGFLSELYVELTPGDPSLPPIQNDAEISSGVVPDPGALMTKVQSMEDSLQTLLGSLTTTGRGIAAGHGTLGKLTRDEQLYQNVVSLTREATIMTQRLSRNQEIVTARLLGLTTSLDSLTQQVQHGNGTVTHLLTSGELYHNLASGTARLDSLLGVVQSGQGTFGRMMADTTLYADTKALVGSMKRLMAEIEKNPKKYLKFSVF